MADSEDLTSTEKAIAQVASMHMNDAGQNCYLSLAGFERESSFTRKTVIAALKSLTAKGWLKQVPRLVSGRPKKNHSSIEYLPVWPGEDESASGVAPLAPLVASGIDDHLASGIDARHIRKNCSGKATVHKTLVGDNSPTRESLCEECDDRKAKLNLPGTTTRVCYVCWRAATGREINDSRGADLES